MSTTVTLTIADLHSRNVTPAAHEAVAILLSLMDYTRTNAVNHDSARLELPSIRTIHLAGDGSVSTQNPAEAFTPADLARLLQQIIEDTPGVPPGLMYSIARALRAVEAPPFESTGAFVRALSRFERGERADVVRRLVERFEAAPRAEALASGWIERRRTPVLVNDLRKELRAADRRWYEEAVTRIPIAAFPPHVTDTPMRIVRVAIAVTFAVALACIATADNVVPAAAVPSLVAVAAPVGSPVAPSASEETAPATAPTPVAALPPTPVKSGARPPASHHATPARAAGRAKKDSHIHVVFRLGWMKHLIEIHSS